MIGSLEWLTNFSLFGPNKLLSWDLLRLRPGRIYTSRVAQTLFSRPSLFVALMMRVASALVLIFSGNMRLAIYCLILIAATNWLLHERSWLGADGSDQMGQIVAIGAAIWAFGAVFADNALILAGVVLIAGQLALSYFVAGVAKLISPTWRCGAALPGIMGTHSYGHGIAASAVSRSPAFNRALCWLIMSAETAFPITLLLPTPIFLGVLALFLAFQLSNAVLMGLNGFVWSFSAAFPAALVCNMMLRDMVR